MQYLNIFFVSLVFVFQDWLKLLQYLEMFWSLFKTIQNKLNRRQLDLCPFALQQPRPRDSTWRSLAYSLLWTGWCCLIIYKLVPPSDVEHADPLQARRLTNWKTLIVTLRVSDMDTGQHLEFLRCFKCYHFTGQGGVATLGGVHPRTLKTRFYNSYFGRESKENAKTWHLPSFV